MERIIDVAFDCGDCEFKSAFAESGECVENSTRCLCPPGFTGVDDWLVADDCHVNIDLAFGVNAFVLVVKALGLIISLATVILLARKWDLSLLAPVPTSDASVSSRDGKGNAKLVALRVNTLRVNMFLVLFTFAGVGYNGLYLLKADDGEMRRTIRDLFPLHAFCLSFSYTGIFGALFLMLKTWYDTLPDVTAYGKLFKVVPFFINYPTLVPKVSIVMIWGAFIVPLIVVVGLPIVMEDEYYTIATIIIIMSIFYVFLFGVMQYVVITSVMKIYKDILEADINKSTSNGVRHSGSKMFSDAHRTSLLLRRFFTGVWFFSMFCGFAYLAVENSHQYLIFNGVSFGPCLIAILFPPVSILRTSGGLAPYQGAVSRSRTPGIVRRTNTFGQGSNNNMSFMTSKSI